MIRAPHRHITTRAAGVVPSSGRRPSSGPAAAGVRVGRPVYWDLHSWIDYLAPALYSAALVALTPPSLGCTASRRRKGAGAGLWTFYVTFCGAAAIRDRQPPRRRARARVPAHGAWWASCSTCWASPFFFSVSSPSASPCCGRGCWPLNRGGARILAVPVLLTYWERAAPRFSASSDLDRRVPAGPCPSPCSAVHPCFSTR